MGVTVRALTGEALEAALEGVAALRIAVFRDWPYLYDGTLDYEREYLQTYRTSANALLVGAFEGDRLVGASTSTPMEDHAEAFAAPFAGQGIPLTDIYYGAESVLLPEYRGKGLGHHFFDLREEHARALGRSAGELESDAASTIGAVTASACIRSAGTSIAISVRLEKSDTAVQQISAQSRSNIKNEVTFRSPKPLQKASEHHQNVHVHQNMKRTAVHEKVRNDLIRLEQRCSEIMCSEHTAQINSLSLVLKEKCQNE